MAGGYIYTEPGDLLLVRGRDWVSKEIETITHSTYSHVAIVASGTSIIEAQGFRKVGYNTLDAYRGMADLYRIDNLSGKQRQRIVDAAKKHIGQRYDYALIAFEYIRCAFGLPLPWFEGNRVICSTLAKDAYLEGIHIDLSPETDYPTPGEVALFPKLRKVASF